MNVNVPYEKSIVPWELRCPCYVKHIVSYIEEKYCMDMVLFFMPTNITFIRVQHLIFYTPNTENGCIYCKQIIIYKNISIVFGLEYLLFLYCSFFHYVLTVFLSYYNVIWNLFFTGFSNVTTVATNLTNPDRESNHEIINTILFG